MNIDIIEVLYYLILWTQQIILSKYITIPVHRDKGIFLNKLLIQNRYKSFDFMHLNMTSMSYAYKIK